MALSDIKSIIQSDLGVNSVDLVRINRAAKELYQNYDLLDSTRECTLDKSDDELVALPWFVDTILAVRPNQYMGYRGNYQHRVNKYRTGVWENGLDYEDAGRSPIKKNILNAAIVEFSIPKPEAESFSVTITGGNNLSASLSETITFAPGETSKYSSNRYRDIFAIAQTKHKYNLSVKDIDGVELALIPNHLEEAQYRIIRTRDTQQLYHFKFPYVDVLYKEVFRPFVNDGDQFICGDRYDQAIVCKYQANLYLGKDDNKARRMIQMSEAYIQQVRKSAQPSLATVEIKPFKTPYRYAEDVE